MDEETLEIPPVSPERNTLIDAYLAQKEAEKILLRARPMYVCIDCYQVFHDGRPDACPKCGKHYR